MIIKSVDKIDFKITYLNGDVRQLSTYNDLMKRIKMAILLSTSKIYGLVPL